MPALSTDLRKLVQIAATAAAALLVLSASRLPASAQTNHMLVIPASDGYGFDECLSGNTSCGRVIADAWCEAHGHSASVSFGRSEDITASVGGHGADLEAAKLAPGTVVVNCAD